MAAAWTTHQANYYATRQMRNSSKKWAEAVLKWILKYARQQWDHQNNELHKWQPNWIKDFMVNTNIQEQYNTGTNEMPRTSAKLFECPMAHILQMSHNDKCWWLALVMAAWNRQWWARAWVVVAAQCTLLYNWLHLQQPTRPQPPPEPSPTA